MPIFERRISISSFSLIFMMSSPSISITPPVMSCRREKQRTSVDLPDPLSPMITSISPRLTSIETSFTPAI